MKDAFETPVVRVRLFLSDGSKIDREWTLNDGPPRPSQIPLPPWLDDPRKIWDGPQDPVELTGIVQTGHEDEARAWVEAIGA
jgi:hypothetical protein